MENKNFSDEFKGFDFGRLFLGIIVLAIGFFYLARGAGIIPANYSINILELWPVLIIYFGLSMIGSRGWLGTAIGIIGTILILIIVGVSLFVGNVIRLGSTQSTQEFNNLPISIARDPSAFSGVINITSGAGYMNINGGTSELIEGNLKTNFMEISKNVSVNNGIQIVDLETSGMGTWNWMHGTGRFTNELDLKMNSGIPLTIFINSGASSIVADFREIMLERADIKTGASSLDLTLGDKLNESAVNINAGMSSIKIHIPQSVGVKLLTNGGLSSTKADKFIKINDNNFESENYKDSNKKVNIEADLGMSSLEMLWQ